MRTIGLIGGMSWESSAQYYRIINQEVRERLGGVHSAKSLMFSVDFGEIERLQHDAQWSLLTGRMIDAAQRLERGVGASAGPQSPRRRRRYGKWPHTRLATSPTARPG